MIEEDMFVAGGDDIVVEDTRVDGVWVLACENGVDWVEFVEASDGLCGGSGLA